RPASTTSPRCTTAAWSAATPVAATPTASPARRTSQHDSHLSVLPAERPEAHYPAPNGGPCNEHGRIHPQTSRRRRASAPPPCARRPHVRVTRRSPAGRPGALLAP